jgi:hypothetical protein
LVCNPCGVKNPLFTPKALYTKARGQRRATPGTDRA